MEMSVGLISATFLLVLIPLVLGGFYLWLEWPALRRELPTEWRALLAERCREGGNHGK